MVPITLIVPELITNCLKHGFKDRSVGHMSISLRRCTSNKAAELTVSDDGCGMTGPSTRGARQAVNRADDIGDRIKQRRPTRAKSLCRGQPFPHNIRSTTCVAATRLQFARSDIQVVEPSFSWCKPAAQFLAHYPYNRRSRHIRPIGPADDTAVRVGKPTRMDPV